MSTPEEILRALHVKHSYAFFDGPGPYDLGLFGVRRAANMDTFNDLLGCTYRATKSWPLSIELWRGTTDPGKYYLQNPIHDSGTGIVVPGQHRGCWKIGLHQGKYKALVQRGKMTIALDANRDTVLDLTAHRVTGDSYGINCHHAGTDSSVVGKWSAGCQVHKATLTFDRMMTLVDAQIAAHPTWDTFTYTLFDVAEDPEVTELFDHLP